MKMYDGVVILDNDIAYPVEHAQNGQAGRLGSRIFNILKDHYALGEVSERGFYIDWDNNTYSIKNKITAKGAIRGKFSYHLFCEDLKPVKDK
jgi:hypothetical protein